jgi:ketosteroid isomerase-like protein
LDKAGAQDWLRRYVAAWKNYDRADIAALYSADATYQYHPFDQPVRGRDAIVDSWLEDPRDEPGTYDAAYAPVALAGDLVISNGRSRYFGPDRNVIREYDNIFVMRFDADGRCREFREWYMPRRGQTG